MPADKGKKPVVKWNKSRKTEASAAQPVGRKEKTVEMRMTTCP
jgi:hypothetical protein